ncbi:MAG: glycosyltransferase [Desulfobacterales bacterium]|nr:glycosyltransferase [Desulfobacterales bacterium]
MKTVPVRRICFVNGTRFWGGGEKWHFDTAVYLAEQGHRVWCAAHPKGALFHRLEATGVKRFPIAMANASFLNPVKMFNLALFFRSNRIQTVVFNGSAEMKLAAPAAAAAGVPTRVYRRGLALPVKGGALNRFMFRRMVTHFLANSHHTADTLFQHLPRPSARGRVKIIYNGVDMRRFSPPAQRPDTLDAHRPLVLGTAGRLVDQKGHEYLVDMAARLKEEKLPFTVLIAGDGPLAPVIEQQITARGLEKEVFLLGFVKDTASLMQQLDIFILPSLWEGFGFAMVEAMASALPVVAFDLTSNPEIVEHGRTGLLVAPKQPGALAAAVTTLAKDPALRRKMGEAGRQRAAERFDRGRQMKKVEAYLCSEIANGM